MAVKHIGKSGLIEAYWNVNLNFATDELTTEKGLIEAYWNVNWEKL